MTGRSLKSITPDGITGMIFAVEGMKNAIVLLNGPMGCRFYHSTTSRFLSIRPMLLLPTEDGQRVPVDYNYLNDFFFRQDRVPCTYLDGYDYVYGTRDKVRRALDFIRDSVSFDFLAIVNSPGAALIGDNLLELAREKLGESRVVMLESPGYSTSLEEGYSEASLALLRQTGPALWKDLPTCADGKKRVNLLGLSIWHRYFEGDLLELRRLFSLCGIEVNAALCADCSLEELRAMPLADLNVVICPEMGLSAAEYLAGERGMPYYVCEALPIGFSAVEKLFGDVCAMLGVSDEPVRLESERARALAWYRVNQTHQAYGRPRGVKFSVDGSPSQVKGFSEFLTHYLGMEIAPSEEAELVFGDANVIAELKLRGKPFCGIEISLPGMGYVDMIPKTHLGVQGALFLIEQVLNGLMSKL